MGIVEVVDVDVDVLIVSYLIVGVVVLFDDWF